MTIVPARTTVATSVAALSILLLAPLSHAQMGDPTKVTLKTTPVSGNVSMIEGANGFAGGNVGVSVGDDGVLVIDLFELEPLAPKLRTALAGLSKKPVRFVINTHLHLDHTGGNATLERRRRRHRRALQRPQAPLRPTSSAEFLGQKKTIPASPAVALPVVTFNDDLTLFFNGDEIHVVHVAPAHTDGDARSSSSRRPTSSTRATCSWSG